MPLVLEKVEKGAFRLALWKVEETFEDLEKELGFSNERSEEFKKIKLSKRRTEWLGRQFLFNYLDVKGLSYESTGKPVLNEGFISISHCDQFVTVILAGYPVGADLQNPVPIIERIGRKFCNNFELDWIEKMENPLVGYSLVWSIKEAVFKIYGEELPFAEGMKVKLCSDLQTARCEVNTSLYAGDFNIRILKEEDYFLVYNEN